MTVFIALGSGVAVLLTIGIYIYFFMTATQLRIMRYSYAPVRMTMNQYGVRRYKNISLEEGDRILVPTGDYQGIWRVCTTSWTKDDEPIVGKQVVDMTTRRTYMYNGKEWTTILDQLFGKGTGYLVGHKWQSFRWSMDGPSLVVQEPMDGSYNIVMSNGERYPLSIIEGKLYSTLPVHGNRITTKHLAAIH